MDRKNAWIGKQKCYEVKERGVQLEKRKSNIPSFLYFTIKPLEYYHTVQAILSQIYAEYSNG